MFRIRNGSYEEVALSMAIPLEWITYLNNRLKIELIFFLEMISLTETLVYLRWNE
jgi:hypothetical protein